MNLGSVATVTGRLRSWAVIGAWAMAARGYVRQTNDFDLMTTDSAALNAGTWSDLVSQNFSVDVRRGDHEDPLAGVVRIRSGSQSIDVVVAKYKWQQAVIDRAEAMTVAGSQLPVPRTADLILLKLFAGGHGDLHDVMRLLEIGPRRELVAEVEGALAQLPDAMRELWRGLTVSPR